MGNDETRRAELDAAVFTIFNGEKAIVADTVRQVCLALRWYESLKIGYRSHAIRIASNKQLSSSLHRLLTSGKIEHEFGWHRGSFDNPLSLVRAHQYAVPGILERRHPAAVNQSKSTASEPPLEPAPLYG